MTGYPLTDTQRIEIARYYLTHLDETQRQVAEKFGVAHITVSNALKYYQMLRAQPIELEYKQRFENLIISYTIGSEL